jgi:hypothetical protein
MQRPVRILTEMGSNLTTLMHQDSKARKFAAQLKLFWLQGKPIAAWNSAVVPLKMLASAVPGIA